MPTQTLRSISLQTGSLAAASEEIRKLRQAACANNDSCVFARCAIAANALANAHKPSPPNGPPPMRRKHFPDYLTLVYFPRYNIITVQSRRRARSAPQPPRWAALVVTFPAIYRYLVALSMHQSRDLPHPPITYLPIQFVWIATEPVRNVTAEDVAATFSLCGDVTAVSSASRMTGDRPPPTQDDLSLVSMGAPLISRGLFWREF